MCTMYMHVVSSKPTVSGPRLQHVCALWSTKVSEEAWKCLSHRKLRSVQLESGSFVIFMMGSWFIRLMDVFCYWFLRKPSVKWWHEVVARCFFLASLSYAMPPCLLHGWSAFDAFVQARLSTETLVLCIVILILGWSWLMNCGRNAEAEGASVVKWS